MSGGFEDNDGYVGITNKVVTTDSWGSSTTEFIPTFMILAEVKARDINKQAGKEVIQIISTTEMPQSRKR